MTETNKIIWAVAMISAEGVGYYGQTEGKGSHYRRWFREKRTQVTCHLGKLDILRWMAL